MFADKTTNAYAVEKDAYNKLLREYITKDYKKADPVLLKNINEEARDITNNLKLSGRVQQYSEKCGFITFKDHKPNFRNKIKCRLINPAKTEIGKISSEILKRVNDDVRRSTDVCQWRDTKSVLEWFKEIKNKKKT